jgi:hypothetical protein
VSDPTPESLAQAERHMASMWAALMKTPEDFDGAHDEYRAAHKAYRTAFIEKAQSHPDCHPAALCDGPEQARAVWSPILDCLRWNTLHSRWDIAADKREVFSALAEDAARAAAQGGRRA